MGVLHPRNFRSRFLWSLREYVEDVGSALNEVEMDSLELLDQAVPEISNYPYKNEATHAQLGV